MLWLPCPFYRSQEGRRMKDSFQKDAERVINILEKNFDSPCRAAYAAIGAAFALCQGRRGQVVAILGNIQEEVETDTVEG